MFTYFPVLLVYVRARLGELQTREEGVTAVEYALMVAIIAVLMVVGFYTLFQMIQDRYQTVSGCIDSGPEPGVCSAPSGR